MEASFVEGDYFTRVILVSYVYKQNKAAINQNITIEIEHFVAYHITIKYNLKEQKRTRNSLEKILIIINIHV